MSRVWSAAGIALSFHRIGRAGWSHDGVLRSWAEARWHLFDDGVAVACLPGDAVWLGLTNTAGVPVDVTLTATAHSGTRRLQVPPDWQLGWLPGPGAEPVPLELTGAPSNAYRVNVQRKGGTPEGPFGLVLMSPAAWNSQFEPVDLLPAEQPPAVPRYSRIVQSRPLGPPLRDS